MVRRSCFIAAVLFLGVCGTTGAQELLVRLTPPALALQAESLRNRLPLLAELEEGGIALLTPEAYQALASSGSEVFLLDRDPSLWDYWMVGLRPDSPLEEVRRAGDVVHTEGNWILLRTAPGYRPTRLQEGPFFVAPLPREPLAKVPSPPPCVGPEPGRPERALGVDPLVQKIVAGVSPASVDAVWGALSPPNGTPTPTRYTSDAGCGDDAAYCYDLMAGYGLAVSYQDYGGTSRAPNVIAVLPGGLTPSRVYLVEGHLDDMPSSGYAPGADDNASGTVVVLEAARALSCYAFKSTVKFLAVTGEETGLQGSAAYAADALSRSEDIRGVLNLDMPGWAGDGLPSSGETLDLNYDSHSQDLALFFAQCAADYETGLSVDAFLCPSLTASDHYPFWQRGYKAVCGITDNEGYCGHAGHYPYYHTSGDTIANCGDRTFFYRVVRTSVAALAALAEPFKILLDQSAYTCGEDVAVVVGDRDLNTAPGSPQTAEVEVWSDTEGTPEVVLLTEDGDDSMLFRGTVPLTTAAPAHGDGLLSVRAGDALVARYRDALDCDGAQDVPYEASASFALTSFPGLASVSNAAGATCALTLTWPGAGALCTSGVTYRVYRSTDGAFVPSADTRIASGLTGTSYTDAAGLLPGTAYFYIVRSADGDGVEDGNSTVLGGVPTGAYSQITWAAGGEPADPALSLEGLWGESPTYSRSGTRSYYSGYPDASCTALVTPPLLLGAESVLTYYGLWSTERGRDGGQVQITQDGGATWTTLTPVPNYPTLLTSPGNACGLPSASRVYSGNSAAYPNAWQKATAQLHPDYAGKTVQLRWRLTTDDGTAGSGPEPGWYVDDISITQVQVAATCATVYRPGETSPGHDLASALRWSGAVTLAWAANPAASAYTLLRGSPEQLPDLVTPAPDHCVRWSGAETACAVDDTPGAGSFYWYLVLGTNLAGHGDAGPSTAGPRMVDGTGSCP